MSTPLYYSTPRQAAASTPTPPAVHELAHQHDLHIELFDEPRLSLFQRVVAWFKGQA